jgi:hypothetical protein
MNESIFVQAPATVPDGMAAHGTHKAFAMMDADNPSDYQFNHTQGEGIRGTLVPVPSANGGIKGSENPFGKIVMGTELRNINGVLQEVPFTPTWLGDSIKKKKGAQPMAPPPPPTEMPSPAQPQAATGFPDLLGGGDQAAIDQADAAVVELAMAHKARAQVAVNAQAEADTQLTDLIQSMNNKEAQQAPAQMPQTVAPPVAAPQPQAQPTVSPEMMTQFNQMMQLWGHMQGQPVTTQAPVAPPVTPPVQAPTPQVVPDVGFDPTEIPPTRIKLSGAFGTSRGQYKQVQITDEFIILVYDEDANIFTPPSSEATFKLSCNREEYEVYFAGVEFDLPFYNCGVQVMIRS